MEAARTPWPALGVLLIRDGLVSAEQLEEVLEERHDGRGKRLSSRRLGEALVGTRLRDERTGRDARRGAARAAVHRPHRARRDRCRSRVALPEETRAPPDGAPDPGLPGRLAARRRGRSDEAWHLRRDPPEAACRSASPSPRPDLIEVAIDEACADQRFRSADVVDATETLEKRDAEGSGHETGLYLATVPEAAEPPVTSGHYERAWRVLGSLLLRDGLVTELELEAALAQQRLSSTRRLGEILIQRGA